MKVLDFQPRLRGITKLILTLLAQLATLLVNRIKDPETKMMAKGVLDGMSKTIKVLSDTDPDDKAQMQAIFNDMMKAGDFRNGSSAELLERIALIEDQDTRIFLTHSVSQIYPVADILTDTNPANSEQARTHVRELLRSDQGLSMLQSFFGIILPDDYADTAGMIIIELLLSVLDETGENPLFAGQLRARKAAYEQRLIAA